MKQVNRENGFLEKKDRPLLAAGVFLGAAALVAGTVVFAGRMVSKDATVPKQELKIEAESPSDMPLRPWPLPAFFPTTRPTTRP